MWNTLAQIATDISLHSRTAVHTKITHIVEKEKGGREEPRTRGHGEMMAKRGVRMWRLSARDLQKLKLNDVS